VKFDLRPTLIGELVSLHPLELGDFEELYSVAADPEIWRQHPDPNRYQREVFAPLFKEWMKQSGTLIARDCSTNKVIGSSRYYDLDEDKSQVAIGFTFLARECWGHTFNREMKKLMLDHAFSFIQTVLFNIAESNTRSQKAIQKIGAQLLGRRENEYNGAPVPYLIFQINKTDYTHTT
jgi:RimJ/RimL family protein N-acetyltransferase